MLRLLLRAHVSCCVLAAIKIVNDLCLAVPDLCCCVRAFSSCGEGRLISSYSLKAAHSGGVSYCGSQALEHGLNSCGKWA